MNNLPLGADSDPRAPWLDEKEKRCLYCNEESYKDFCDAGCEIAYLND